jgi:hypothetical protein
MIRALDGVQRLQIVGRSETPRSTGQSRCKAGSAGIRRPDKLSVDLGRPRVWKVTLVLKSPTGRRH